MVRVTRKYELTTEHEIDLTMIDRTDSALPMQVSLASEYNTLAACDALRAIKSDKFKVITGDTGSFAQKSKTEIVEFIYPEKA